MRTSRRKVEEVLWAAGLHKAAVNAYRRVSRRDGARVQSFYSTLLKPGMLVFDIGANLGMMSEAFLNIGCRVVAVEPNRDCIRHIELTYPNRMEVIQAVAGPKNGLATINLSDERDDISSVSDEWVAHSKSQNPELASMWTRRQTVPMLTLDTLAEHFGRPDFIKIDVEGYEEAVLSGLSFQPRLLSFEFNLSDLGAAERCAAKFSDSRFSFAFGDPASLESTWVSADELMKSLRTANPHERYGDVFVMAEQP